MHIDNVIFGLDGSPIYEGMWELTSRAWSRLGVTPHVFCISDRPLSETHGTVHRLPASEFRPRWLAPCAMLWGACRIPGVNMISGIDQVPLSDCWLRVCRAMAPCDMTIGFAGAPGYQEPFCGMRHYPTSHVVARREVWSAVLQPGDWQTCVSGLAGRQWRTMWPGWGQDERWFAESLAEAHGLIVANLPAEFFAAWDRARLDRDRNDMPAADQEYSEMHLHRPLESNPREWLELVA